MARRSRRGLGRRQCNGFVPIAPHPGAPVLRSRHVRRRSAPTPEPADDRGPGRRRRCLSQPPPGSGVIAVLAVGVIGSSTPGPCGVRTGGGPPGGDRARATGHRRAGRRDRIRRARRPDQRDGRPFGRGAARASRQLRRTRGDELSDRDRDGRTGLHDAAADHLAGALGDRLQTGHRSRRGARRRAAAGHRPLVGARRGAADPLRARAVVGRGPRRAAARTRGRPSALGQSAGRGASTASGRRRRSPATAPGCAAAARAGRGADDRRPHRPPARGRQRRRSRRARPGRCAG